MTQKRRTSAAARLVAGYIKGIPFLDLLRSLPSPRSAATRAMLALRQAFTGRHEPEAAIRLAEAALGAEPDPDVLIVLHELWISLCNRLGRQEEAEALLRRAKGLVSERTPPELRGSVLVSEGLLLANRGDKRRRDLIYQEIMALLPADSPRRRIIAWDRAMNLAALGRLAEVEEDLRWLESSGFFPSRLALARLVNAAETGRAGEAERLLPAVEADKVMSEFAAESLAQARALIDLARGRKPASDDASTMGAWHLLSGDAVEALRLAREAVGRAPNAVFFPGFYGFTLPRAELSSGHGEAARQLLERRREAGSDLYLDDFFWGRVELLAGRRAEAGRLFAAAVKSCRSYGALGRLELELSMSRELAPREVLDFARLLGAPAELAPAAVAAPVAAEPAAAREAPVPAAAEPRGVARLLGPSAAMAQVRGFVEQLAAHDVPVLIVGETGVGKELVARALHEAGPRAAEPFLAVNCGAIAETLLESELFGHEKGAFTGAHQAHRGIFESAGRGTVLLDEIGEVSARLQTVLLRVLETGEIRPVGSAASRKVSCRILAATNAEIEKLVAAGRFRQDLLFRLMRMVVRVPPLRERPEDILPLAGHFLNLGRMQLRRAEMAPELGSALRRYSWPGNVRELRNEVERMRLTNSDGLAYDLANLEPGIAGKARGEPAGAAERTGLEPQAVRIAEAAEAARAARVELEAAQAEAEAGLLAGDSLLRRRGRLRELFARHRMLTRKEAARLLAVSGNTATAYLQRLIMEGLIERVMPNSSPRTHYFTLKGMKLAGLVPPEGWTKEGRLDKSGKPPKIINLQWVDKPGTGGAKPPKPKGLSPLQKYLKRLRKQRGGRR